MVISGGKFFTPTNGLEKWAALVCSFTFWCPGALGFMTGGCVVSPLGLLLQSIGPLTSYKWSYKLFHPYKWPKSKWVSLVPGIFSPL